MCGSFTVTTQGQYGFLLVYRDDFTTPDIDEGAEPGDTITFYINDHIALTKGPDAPVWTLSGDIIELDLEGRSNWAPVISANFPDTIIFRSDSTHSLELNEYVHDDDDPVESLHWSTTGNYSVTITIDEVTHLAVFSASHTFSGAETVVFIVTDDSLANDSTTVFVQVIPYVYSIDLSLNENWNLVSWDVNPSNDSVEVLFNDILSSMTVMLGFDLVGLVYDPLRPEFSNLLQTNPLNGYWIKTDAACGVSLIGSTIPNDTAIILNKGWNLVSYLPDEPDSVMHALESIIDNLVVAMGYNGGGLSCYPPYPDFNNLHILSPKYGYWVKVSDKDTLIYPENTVAAGKGLAKANIFTSNRELLKPTNEWINVFGEEELFDNLLLQENSLVEALDPDNVVCGEYIVTKKGQFGMMPVYRDDPLTEVDEGAVPGDYVRIFIDGNEINTGVIWDQFGTAHRITINGIDSHLPKEFKLYHNFPNPFNPVTNIQFQLPKISNVNLMIYDLKGCEVRNLLQQEMKPGLHTISWDGKDNRGKLVSSGVYFYTLKAGNYKHTEKMIFLR